MLWYSSEAYDAWVKDIANPITEVGNYKTIIYNTLVDIGADDRGHNDRGIIATEIVAYCTNIDIFEDSNHTPSKGSTIIDFSTSPPGIFRNGDGPSPL